MLTPNDSTMMNMMCGRMIAHRGLLLDWRITNGKLGTGLDFVHMDGTNAPLIKLRISPRGLYITRGTLPYFGVSSVSDQNFFAEFLRKAKKFKGNIVKGKPKYEYVITETIQVEEEEDITTNHEEDVETSVVKVKTITLSAEFVCPLCRKMIRFNIAD